MLIIRRREGESLVLGAEIELEVLEISGNHVKLGIRAPREIPVMRKEMDATRRQNQSAARGIDDGALARLQHSLQARLDPPDKPHE